MQPAELIDYTVGRAIVTHGLYRVEPKYGRRREIHPLSNLISYLIAYYNYDKSIE